MEFAEHRQYNSGESTRHIDWKLFARTDKFFVKRFEEETNLDVELLLTNHRLCIFLKGSSSIENPNKLHFSILCAAALMNLLKRQRDAVGLSLFSDKVILHTNEKTSTKHHQYLLHELDKVLNQAPLMKTSRLVDGLHQIAKNIHQRSLVIFSVICLIILRKVRNYFQHYNI